jgi:hypothetical protein
VIEMLDRKMYRAQQLRGAARLAHARYEAAKAPIDASANVNAASGNEGLTPLMIAAAETRPPEGSVFLPTSTRPLDVAKALIKTRRQCESLKRE